MACRLESINVSTKKGTVKKAVKSARLEAGFGIVGDAHAGPGHRQISLLAQEDIDQVARSGVVLKPGAFGENLAVSGVDLHQIGIGSVLTVGEAELRITQIGKKCHTRCAIYTQTGDCIMPREGLFAEVTRSGDIAKGDLVICESRSPRTVIQAGVITVSDRCAAGENLDTAGPAVADLLKREIGANIAVACCISDDLDLIAAAISDYADRGLDIVITVGGTGLSPRDVTPQATRKVIDLEVPGIAEAMRAASLAQTPRAMLSRGIAGVRGRCLVINLPGSQKAAAQNLQAVLPVLSHAVKQLRGERDHPEP